MSKQEKRAVERCMWKNEENEGDAIETAWKLCTCDIPDRKVHVLHTTFYVPSLGPYSSPIHVSDIT
jgi:hypothetical protein